MADAAPHVFTTSELTSGSHDWYLEHRDAILAALRAGTIVNDGAPQSPEADAGQAAYQRQVRGLPASGADY